MNRHGTPRLALRSAICAAGLVVPLIWASACAGPGSPQSGPGSPPSGAGRAQQTPSPGSRAAAPTPEPSPTPTEPPRVSMTIVGDIMLARRVGDLMRDTGDFAAPLRPAARRLAGADLTVGNLEGTLSRTGAPRQGDDSFGANPRALRGLRLAGFDVLTLANNHVGDYGPRALVETVERVRRAGIVPVGAGADAQKAGRPAIVERAGVRFGFLAFNAIGETPEAGPGTPGAAQLRMQPRLGPLHRPGLRALLADVRALRPRVDVLAVLPHWGDQYTHAPVPDQRTVASALVGAGADLVVGSHPHWIQGSEVRRGALVAYSLGNFVFDMDFSRETQRGIALELTFRGGDRTASSFSRVRIGADFAPRFAAPPTPAG
ncbi:MAG: CapA family protein [Streptomycetales bacterium]